MSNEKLGYKVTRKIWIQLAKGDEHSIRGLARQYGVSPASVQRIANGTHASTKHLGKPRVVDSRRPIDKDVIEDARRLWRQGETVWEIVDTLGISPSSVYRFIK
mgnify:CR=1 FL=1